MLVRIVALPEMDPVELLDLNAVAVAVTFPVFVTVSDIKEVEVGDRVPEALVALAV